MNKRYVVAIMVYEFDPDTLTLTETDEVYAGDDTINLSAYEKDRVYDDLCVAYDYAIDNIIDSRED